MNVLKNYVSDATSPTKGMVAFDSIYKASPIVQPNAVPLDYEIFWYQNGRCVGAKRQNNLPMTPNSQGAIYFLSSGTDSFDVHAHETANAAVRLLLDVRLKNAIVAGVVVPDASFYQVADALADLNFLPLEKTGYRDGERPSIHLISYPKGKDQYFFYNDSRQ